MQLRRFAIGAGIASAAAAAVLGLGMPSAVAASSWNDANSDGQIDMPDTGDAVRCVQRAVLFDGFSVGSSGVDGRFGNDTKNAVLAYQSRYQLGHDGKVGVQTGGKMVSQITSYSRTAHQTGGDARPFDAWLSDCVNRYNNNQGQSIFHV
jgi:peptidoglycan hydrolase-like protein with peptidoglycan-binding domain